MSTVRGVRNAESCGRQHVLVLFAVRDEAKHFKLPGDAAEVVISGIGKRNAEQALLRAIESSPPRLVLTCGYAGGLNPQLPRGTVLFDADARADIGEALGKLGAVPGTFHCAERILVSAREKQALWLKTGLDAVEMESGVIRELCRTRGIASATIRVISDAVDQDLPMDFNRLAKPDGNVSYAKLAGALMKSPALVPKLMRFQRELDACSRTLAEVLRGLLVGLRH